MKPAPVSSPVATSRREPPAGRLQQELRQNVPFASLHAEAFLNLVRTTDQLQHTLRARLKSHGITETQYNLLRILRGAGEAGLACSEIAERLITRDPDVTRLLGRLERMALVQRTRDAKDRRVVVARISQQGLERLKDLDPLVAQTITGSLSHLSEPELHTMIRLLEQARSRAVKASA